STLAANEFTTVGCAALMVVPSPISPFALLPQQSITPVAISAHACCSVGFAGFTPVAIEVTPPSAAKTRPPEQKPQSLKLPTSVGVRWSTLSMAESSPESLAPQHDVVP